MAKLTLSKMTLQPNSRAGGDNAAITDRGRLRVTTGFQAENGIAEKGYYELYFDGKTTTFGVKFFTENGHGRYKVVRTRGTAQIELGPSLYKNGLRISVAGAVPLVWSKEEDCLFVELVSAVAEAERRPANKGHANLVQNRPAKGKASKS